MSKKYSRNPQWIVDGDRAIKPRKVIGSAVQVQLAEDGTIGFLLPSGIIVQFSGEAAAHFKGLMQRTLQDEGFTTSSETPNMEWFPPESRPLEE